jgi:hypothetical protein
LLELAWRPAVPLAWRLAVPLALGLGCAAPPPAEVRDAERLRRELERALAEAPAGEGLRVLLAFGAGADLDLYVTDPLQETVYFANSPSASGGRLEADLHCGSPGQGDRIEEVRFREPPAGRYRVGLDYPESCGPRAPAGYALAVVRGGAVELHTGTLQPLEFRLAALDFELRSEPGAGEPPR